MEELVAINVFGLERLGTFKFTVPANVTRHDDFIGTDNVGCIFAGKDGHFKCVFLFDFCDEDGVSRDETFFGVEIPEEFIYETNFWN